jgi:hypothetical protein
MQQYKEGGRTLDAWESTGIQGCRDAPRGPLFFFVAIDKLFSFYFFFALRTLHAWGSL